MSASLHCMVHWIYNEPLTAYHVDTHVHVHRHLYRYTCTCTYMYTYTDVHVHRYTCTYIDTHVHVHVRTYMYMLYMCRSHTLESRPTCRGIATSCGGRVATGCGGRVAPCRGIACTHCGRVARGLGRVTACRWREAGLRGVAALSLRIALQRNNLMSGQRVGVA